MKLNRLLLASLLAASAGPLFAVSDMDRKIEDAIKASYNYRTVLDEKVAVKVNDGVVTLSGTVADRDLKTVAEETATNLPGVVRVDNKITVDSSLKEHSDAWIAWKTRYQLLVHSNVSSRDTKVDVKDGVVTLTGTADNAAQKDLSSEYAKDIDNVKSVNNQMVVAPSSTRSESMGESIDDASITSQVKLALLNHKSTHALKTSVTTTGGIVTITGVANNDAEKSLVEKLASSIRGVKSVTNSMTVAN